MPDRPALIPIAEARAATWPAADGRRRLRILREPTPAQRAWVAARGGRIELVDTTGAGDGQAFYLATGRAHGWADDREVRRELARLDCPIGDWARRLMRQLGEDAATTEAA